MQVAGFLSKEPEAAACSLEVSLAQTTPAALVRWAGAAKAAGLA